MKRFVTNGFEPEWFVPEVGYRFSAEGSTYTVVFMGENGRKIFAVREDLKSHIVISAHAGKIRVTYSMFDFAVDHSLTYNKFGNFESHEGIPKSLRKSKTLRPVKVGDVLMNKDAIPRKVEFVGADNALVFMGEKGSFLVNPARIDADEIFMNAKVEEYAEDA